MSWTSTDDSQARGIADAVADLIQDDASSVASALKAAFVSSTDPAALITSPDGVSQSGLWMPAVSRSPLPAPSKIVSRFPSGHGWVGGTDDLTAGLFTDRSYKVTTGGTGASTYLTSPIGAAVDCSKSVIRIVFKVDNATRLSTLAINATSSTGNAYSANVQTNVISGEWCIATINRSQFSIAVGAPDWTAITKWDVWLRDKGASAPVTIWLAAVELLPDLSATYPNGVFIMECDDGYAGQKTFLAPVVGQRGIPVTYNVITERFTGDNPPSGMTPADLRTFQDKYGWQISCHAYAMADHGGTPSTAATMEASFQRQKQWLHANGLHSGVDHLALCPGTGSPVAEGAMMDVIRRSFRSVRVNSGYYETAIPADPLRLRSVLFSGAGQTVANLQTNITAIAGAGGAFIYTIHDVVSGATDGTSNGLSAQAAVNLATVLDFAASKGMAFRTRADFIDGR